MTILIATLSRQTPFIESTTPTHNGAGSGLKLTVCNNTREAAKGADMVTTVTASKTNAAIITPDMIEPGMHLTSSPP
jgi:ornithine cyclodeaminase/alanine dehydrogenase-like protein (mu-crystallin family)